MLKTIATGVAGVAVCLFCIVLSLGGSLFAVVFLLPIRPFSRQRYFDGVQWVAHGCWTWLVWAYEEWGGIEYHWYGDDLPVRENSVVIANHKFFLDWTTVFALACRKGRVGGLKVFAKDFVKWVPGFGWGVYLAGSVMLKRDWTRDAANIRRTFSTLASVDVPLWLLSHVEGTRMSPKKYAESVKFSKDHDLPVFKNLLYPRTKGFVATVEGLRGQAGIASVVVMIIHYERFPSLLDVVLRTMPPIHVYVRRVAMDDMPPNGEPVKQWLVDTWLECDDILGGMQEGKYPREIDVPLAYLPAY